MSISNVNGPDRLRAAQALSATRNGQPGASPQPASVVRQPDSVSFSPAARAMAAAHRASGEAGAIRADRVAALKAAIANGTYQVDSTTLARKLVTISQ